MVGHKMSLEDIMERLWDETASERYDKALAYARMAYRRAKDNPDVLFTYANSLANVDEDGKAVKVYERLLGMTVRDLANCDEIGSVEMAHCFKNECRCRMAYCLYYLDKYKEALKLSRQAIRDINKHKTRNTTSVKEMGELVEKIKLDDAKDKISGMLDDEKYVAVRPVLRRWLAKYPKDRDLLNQYHLSYHEVYDYEKGLEVIKKAFAYYPNDAAIMFNHAGAYEMLEEYDRAIEFFRAILKHPVQKTHIEDGWDDPVYVKRLKNDVRYRMGNSYYWIGKYGMAKRVMGAYLSNREKGVKSIYSLAMAKRRYREILLEIKT